MKAFRERMKKINTNLTVSTKTEDVVGAGPEQPSIQTTPSKASKTSTSKASSDKQKPQRKAITKVSDRELQGMYQIKGQVMESTHTGMMVLFGKRLSDGLEVVVKTREKATSFKGNWEEREWRATTTTQLNMPKIESMCEYIAVLETWEKYYVIMERAHGMDLFEHMQQEKIKEQDTRSILEQMLTAIDAMHSVGRIHKDLKLENVVVDLQSPKMRRCSTNGSMTSVEAKLIDFDTVEDWEPTSPKAKDVLGTDGYIAPESYMGDYSPASDIYCIGVIMYKLLTGKFPSRPDIFDDLPGENWVGSPAMKRIRDRLMKEKVDFTRAPLDKSPEAQDLVKKMMAIDPNARPTAAEALEHKWFKLGGDTVLEPASTKSASAKPTAETSPASAKSTAAGSGRASPESAASSPQGGPQEGPAECVQEKLALPGTPQAEEKPKLPGEPE
mmetsp:Transcript_23190/g.60531  ORF Transcript_23190/g.60531 Transcript_23190/m.60531 type:complete len:443 (-) Transcript_23190:79-1407(-)